MRANTVDDFWRFVSIGNQDECWEWIGSRLQSGYGRIRMGDGMRLRAHRIAWELANGREIPDNLIVRHKCDNRPCCNPAHLELGTDLDNMRDMVDRCRAAKGEDHGMSKLTEEDVREIRERAAGGELHRIIAMEFGMARTSVSDIVAGKSWGWLE